MSNKNLGCLLGIIFIIIIAVFNLWWFENKEVTSENFLYITCINTTAIVIIIFMTYIKRRQ